MKNIAFELACRVFYTLVAWSGLSLVLYLSLGIQSEYFYGLALNISQDCKFCFESSQWQWQLSNVPCLQSHSSHLGLQPCHFDQYALAVKPGDQIETNQAQSLPFPYGKHHQSQSWLNLNLPALGYFYPLYVLNLAALPSFNLALQLLIFGLLQGFAFWSPSLLLPARLKAWGLIHVFIFGIWQAWPCVLTALGFLNELSIETLDSELLSSNSP